MTSASSHVLRWYAAWNTKEMAVADETVGADVVVHWEAAPDTVGLDAYKAPVAAFWEAFEPLTLTVEQALSDGAMVFVRSRFEGTHVGTFMGLPASGKAVSWRFHNLYRVEDGRWVEAWAFPDSFAMLQQLGAIPGA